MEMDQAINLQMQIRENSEDFKKELRDMAAWEEQMKKKDLEIRSMKDDQVLPPVRTKKKKKSSIPESSQEEKPSKTKRISSNDYNSWDKFDADKACQEIEEKTNPKENEEKIYEVPSKEELEKEHAEALKLKEEGNALVQKREYAKAVGKYSAAIQKFPGDATFYANRALCQLKLDNLYSAESDCTAAIKLDELYVKAYHRRASARIELKQYKDALADLEKILKIEPFNKEAACLLTQVQKKLEKTSQSIIISGNEKGGKNLIEKQIGEKLFGKKSSASKSEKNCNVQEQNNIKEQSKQSKIKNTGGEQEQPNSSKDEKLVTNEIVKEKKSIAEKKKEQNVKQAQVNKKESVSPTSEKPSSSSKSEKEKMNDKLPSWLPKLKKGINIVEPLAEPPRRLSQKLRRIHIQEVPKNESIFKDIELNTEKPEKPKEVEKIEKPKELEKPKKPKNPVVAEKRAIKIDKNSKIINIDKSENKDGHVECNDKKETDHIESLSPPPKSSVAFLLSWRKNTSPIFRHKYLKQIAPENLPNIFKDSLESSTFSEILSILNTKFAPNNDEIYNYLKHLTTVKRFRALILFMTHTDKEVLKNLFEHCKTKEGRTNEEVQELYSAYEM